MDNRIQMHKFGKIWILTMLLMNVRVTPVYTSTKNLPEPYNQLTEILPFDDHGWYSNGYQIEMLMKNNPIKTVIEVGSWLGKSTRHIASLLPQDGVVYAVDTWLGSIETDSYVDKMPTLWVQFLSNVVHVHMIDKIIPVKQDSVLAASYLNQLGVKPDLIYIDAAHDEVSVYNDMKAYWPFVANHQGILCGDDWSWQSVRKAVTRFATEHKLSVYAMGNFWIVAEDGHMILSPINRWKFLGL